MEAHLASTQPTKVNKITTSCKICSDPHDTQYCMENPKQAYVDYASSRANETKGERFTPNQGPRNFKDATNTWREKPNFNWAYSQTFTNPQNESICVYSSSNQMRLEKALLGFNCNQKKSNYSDTEEDVLSTNVCRYDLGKMTGGNEEVKEQGKEENEIETDIEVEEVTEESEFETGEEVEETLEEKEEDKDDENFNSFLTIKELSHHEWLLKNPRPPWVKARIRAESMNNIKNLCMVGHFFKKHAYIDLESPINIMSMRQYNQIMTYGLKSRQKPLNPDKISNFVGRVRSLKIFIGSFAYECDFMILEDTTSIIDRCLEEMVFGRPFINEIGLKYNKEEGTVMFKQDNEKIKFKMPHTMEIFKQTRLMGASIDSIPQLAYKENFSNGRTHYF
uniref:MAK10-like protein n=1 Tax=Tanacetum cinerariifolium TaxID=118510 RepID=A0A699H197_TANCI|nr:MAK10-like protein [Tanacetum cinerariifolium]